MNYSEIRFRTHAIQRMYERKISEADVFSVLEEGKVIEEYPDDTPYPSKLILGWRDQRPLHIVVAKNELDDQLIIITVYEPDPEIWDNSFERRKNK